MSERISVEERGSRSVRCAICHDGARPLVRCPRCSSLFHEVCRRELRQCPTIGCRSSMESDSAPEEERSTEEALPPFSIRRAFLWSVGSGLVPLACLGLAKPTGAHGLFVWASLLWAVFHLALPLVLVLRGRRDVPAGRSVAYGCGLGAASWIAGCIAISLIGLARLDAITFVAFVAAWTTVPAMAAWLADHALGPAEPQR